ncbi:hypothetical protein APED_07030 [Acanthopleuribacter pedis]
MREGRINEQKSVTDGIGDQEEKKCGSCKPDSPSRNPILTYVNLGITTRNFNLFPFFFEKILSRPHFRQKIGWNWVSAWTHRPPSTGMDHGASYRAGRTNPARKSNGGVVPTIATPFVPPSRLAPAASFQPSMCSRSSRSGSFPASRFAPVPPLQPPMGSRSSRSGSSIGRSNKTWAPHGGVRVRSAHAGWITPPMHSIYRIITAGTRRIDQVALPVSRIVNDPDRRKLTNIQKSSRVRRGS